jgi:glucosyl-3-phosphoglycerate synthase
MRIHRNQSTAAFGKMSYGILNTVISRMEKYGAAKFLSELGPAHIALERQQDGGHRVSKTGIPAEERQPMIEVPEYREKFGRDRRG